MASSVYDFELTTIEGESKSLADYAGKALLMVNVASQCGLTPQYAELEEFYQQYKSKGLEILGFPANNFGGQEPGSESEIQQFCTTNYGVSFPMFSKISVKGDDQHALYTYLTETTKSGEVQWNFQKFLIGTDGKPVAYFNPQQSVLEDEILERVERLLD